MDLTTLFFSVQEVGGPTDSLQRIHGGGPLVAAMMSQGSFSGCTAKQEPRDVIMLGGKRYRSIDNQGGGNCQVHALADAVLGKGYTAHRPGVVKTLRMCCSEVGLQIEAHNISPFFNQDGRCKYETSLQGFKRYFSRMNAYGSDVSLIGFSAAFWVRFCVHHFEERCAGDGAREGQPQFKYTHEIKAASAPANAPVICLMHTSVPSGSDEREMESHYMYLESIESEGAMAQPLMNTLKGSPAYERLVGALREGELDSQDGNRSLLVESFSKLALDLGSRHKSKPDHPPTPLIDETFGRIVERKGVIRKGHVFEHWLAALCTVKWGWSCVVSSGSGDGGADIFVSVSTPTSSHPPSPKLKGVIQCKAYDAKRRIEPADAFALAGSMKYFKADFSIMAQLGVGFSEKTHVVFQSEGPMPDALKGGAHGPDVLPDSRDRLNGRKATAMIWWDRVRIESMFRDAIENNAYVLRAHTIVQKSSQCTWWHKEEKVYRGAGRAGNRWKPSDKAKLHELVVKRKAEIQEIQRSTGRKEALFTHIATFAQQNPGTFSKPVSGRYLSNRYKRDWE